MESRPVAALTWPSRQKAADPLRELRLREARTVARDRIAERVGDADEDRHVRGQRRAARLVALGLRRRAAGREDTAAHLYATVRSAVQGERHVLVAVPAAVPAFVTDEDQRAVERPRRV